ncbi:cytochrome b560 subunit of succinate dehydrogenase [Meredithblackwellia eburnea MCA 4105]
MSSALVSPAMRTMALRRGIIRPILASPSAFVSSKRTGQTNRTVSTQALSNDEGLALLNKQRNIRPTSPHFTIYEWQLTWIPSIFHRATGGALSAGIYGLFLGYAVGLPFDSASLLHFWEALPVWFTLTTKAAIAYSGAFHSINGIRHLGWDLGKFISLRSSYAAGYVVLATSFLSGTYLTFFL